MVKERHVSFKIMGSYITNTAREFIGKPMTKAQKEFMYQYYMERDRRAEAIALWEDETNG